MLYLHLISILYLTFILILYLHLIFIPYLQLISVLYLRTLGVFNPRGGRLGRIWPLRNPYVWLFAPS